MRSARLEFPSGRELLGAWWGFIGSGGLVVAPRALQAAGVGDLAEGEEVLLELRIASLRKDYRLMAQLRRRDEQRAVLAFDEGQGQDVLLSAAWADGQGVPERRHRRWELQIPVRYRTFDREGSARIVNLSRGGCCMRVETPLRNQGRIFVVGDGFLVDGTVRWAREGSRLVGVEFSRFHEELVDRLLTPEPSDAPALAAAGGDTFQQTV